MQEAKVQFGYIPKRTVANEAAVRDWLMRKMKEVHVRNVDIARVLPYAVAVVFIPSHQEVVASKLHKALDGQRRQYEGPSK